MNPLESWFQQDESLWGRRSSNFAAKLWHVVVHRNAFFFFPLLSSSMLELALLLKYNMYGSLRDTEIDEGLKKAYQNRAKVLRSLKQGSDLQGMLSHKWPFRRQLNRAFGFKLCRPHISSLPWDFRACWTGLKILKFQCLVGALRSQTRDSLITPQCFSGWILLPKTEFFQNDLWDVKPGRPTCRFRVRWRIERVMEAVSCFLRNKGSCPLQPREGRDADKR